MDITILKEPQPEKRVAISPDSISDMLGLGIEKVYIQSGAGALSWFPDHVFQEAGGTVTKDEGDLSSADMLISIALPADNMLDKTREKQVLITQMNPLGDIDAVHTLREKGLTVFSMDIVPRTTRAQSMDVLSSMATGAGYKAVLIAATKLPRFFPMFMTAAGTIAPAKVLILGAGVAGLQAIATARRLGAVVEAFDVRSAVKEEVESLGAKFVEVGGAQEDESAGGYAVEQSEEYQQKQSQLIQEHATKADVIITTAQIPGREAPLLIKEDTLKAMKPGSVIVDLAASTGGNCAFTENNKTVERDGVTIIGDSNLPAQIASDASRMFGRNVYEFLKLIVKDGQLVLDWEDDIVQGACVCHDKEIVSPWLKSKIENK